MSQFTLTVPVEVTLEPQEVAIILEALGTLPYVKVQPVISNFVMQVECQAGPAKSRDDGDG